MLQEDTGWWWQLTERSLLRTHRKYEDKNEDALVYTWEGFKKMFNDKYFPRSLKEEQIWKFMRLKQIDEMSITQYDTRFI